MTDRATTRERILDASRQLFNEKGYKATTLAEIAATIGIAQGNLTYHFPTKRDLVAELERRLRQSVRARRKSHRRGAVTDDYVELLLFAMNHAWENRFLLRDHAQLTSDPNPLRLDPDMAADLEELHDLLRRMKKEGMFRRDLRLDLGVLARSLWILSRYWMDHLRELEGVEQVAWADQERGLQHHLALLLPCLTASARRDLEAAARRASSTLIDPRSGKIDSILGVANRRLG
jgi:AcrR family transcriptional regulator